MNFSIISPLYNASKFLRATVLSVQNQTCDSWELILVDDCSTDNSLELALELAAEDSRIRVISLEKNSGAAVARNAAVKVSTGRYIAFLDSDDLWLPKKLEAQYSFMKRNNAVFCYSAYEKINEEGVCFGRVDVPSFISYDMLLKTCVIGCLTAVYDTEYFGRVEMPLIRKRQDFGLWLKLLKKVDYAYGIREPLAQYRVRPDSISSNKLNAARYTWKLYRDVERLNLFKSCYYFSHYAIRGVVRAKWPKFARTIGWL